MGLEYNMKFLLIALSLIGLTASRPDAQQGSLTDDLTAPQLTISTGGWRPLLSRAVVEERRDPVYIQETGPADYNPVYDTLPSAAPQPEFPKESISRSAVVEGRVRLHPGRRHRPTPSRRETVAFRRDLDQGIGSKIDSSIFVPGVLGTLNLFSQVSVKGREKRPHSKGNAAHNRHRESENRHSVRVAHPDLVPPLPPHQNRLAEEIIIGNRRKPLRRPDERQRRPESTDQLGLPNPDDGLIPPAEPEVQAVQRPPPPPNPGQQTFNTFEHHPSFGEVIVGTKSQEPIFPTSQTFISSPVVTHIFASQSDRGNDNPQFDRPIAQALIGPPQENPSFQNRVPGNQKTFHQIRIPESVLQPNQGLHAGILPLEDRKPITNGDSFPTRFSAGTIDGFFSLSPQVFGNPSLFLETQIPTRTRITRPFFAEEHGSLAHKQEKPKKHEQRFQTTLTPHFDDHRSTLTPVITTRRPPIRFTFSENDVPGFPPQRPHDFHDHGLSFKQPQGARGVLRPPLPPSTERPFSDDFSDFALSGQVRDKKRQRRPTKRPTFFQPEEETSHTESPIADAPRTPLPTFEQEFEPQFVPQKHEEEEGVFDGNFRSTVPPQEQFEFTTTRPRGHNRRRKPNRNRGKDRTRNRLPEIEEFQPNTSTEPVRHFKTTIPTTEAPEIEETPVPQREVKKPQRQPNQDHEREVDKRPQRLHPDLQVKIERKKPRPTEAPPHHEIEPIREENPLENIPEPPNDDHQPQDEEIPVVTPAPEQVSTTTEENKLKIRSKFSSTITTRPRYSVNDYRNRLNRLSQLSKSANRTRQKVSDNTESNRNEPTTGNDKDSDKRVRLPTRLGITGLRHKYSARRKPENERNAAEDNKTEKNQTGETVTTAPPIRGRYQPKDPLRFNRQRSTATPPTRRDEKTKYLTTTTTERSRFKPSVSRYRPGGYQKNKYLNRFQKNSSTEAPGEVEETEKDSTEEPHEAPAKTITTVAPTSNKIRGIFSASRRPYPLKTRNGILQGNTRPDEDKEKKDEIDEKASVEDVSTGTVSPIQYAKVAVTGDKEPTPPTIQASAPSVDSPTNAETLSDVAPTGISPELNTNPFITDEMKLAKTASIVTTTAEAASTEIGGKTKNNNEPLPTAIMDLFTTVDSDVTTNTKDTMSDMEDKENSLASKETSTMDSMRKKEKTNSDEDHSTSKEEEKVESSSEPADLNSSATAYKIYKNFFNSDVTPSPLHKITMATDDPILPIESFFPVFSKGREIRST